MPTRQEFAQQLRTQYPSQTSRYPDDNQLVDEWMKTHPQDANLLSEERIQTSDEGMGLVPLGLRVVPATLASLAGPVAGGAGAGAGEIAAQIYEYLAESKPIRPAQVGIQTAIGAIPFAGPAKHLSRFRQIATQAGKGGALGGAAVTGTRLGEGELPSAKELAFGVGGGAVFGGGTQALRRPKLIETVTRPPSIEPPPISPVEPPISTAPIMRNVPKAKVKPGDIKFLDPTTPIPPQEPIPPSRLFEFPSIQKMPKEIQPEIQKILEENAGFEAQRRGVQTHPRTQALAEYLTISPHGLKPGTAANAAELDAHKNAVASMMSESMDLAKKIANNPNATDVDKLQLSRMIDRSTVLLKSYRGLKTEAGRALESLKIKARILEMGDASFQQQLMDAPGFRGKLDKIARAMVAAGDDPEKQLTILRKSSGTLFDKATSIYYNSLLSGGKTHIRNTLGNTFNMLANIANPLFAAPVDVLRKAITGKEREVFLGESGQQLTAMFAALPKAWSKALYSMRHGFDLDMVQGFSSGKLDVQNLVELPGGLLTNWPSRLLLASDNFFRTLAKDQELYSSAYAAALKAGKKHPAQIRDYMTNLLTDEKFIARAEKFAKRAVFQEDPGIVINSILRWKNDPNISPLTRGVLTFIAPFVRTPWNILRQGFESSPVGFAMKPARAGGREGAQALGRATAGTLALAPIAFLAATNRLSGSGPTDSAEREALYRSGWQPNSIKVGDKWVKYQLFQPWSVPLTVIGNAWDKFKESDQSDESAESMMVKAVAAAGASVVDQSFLAGINGILDAVSDPERYGTQTLSLLAQGAVPGSGLLRNITQAVDPVVRKPESVKEAVKTIIPGLSEQVPARLTAFGEDVKRPGGAIRRGFIVPEVSEEVKDPIAQRLKELGITPDIPRARIVQRGETIPLTRDQKHVIEQAIGKEKRALLERAGGAGKRMVESKLSDVVSNVNKRALGLIRANKPLTLEVLAPSQRNKRSKEEIDRMYEEYRSRMQGGQ